MKTKTLFTVLALVFFMMSQLSAQTLNTGSVLTWTDCVSLAVQNNPQLSSSRYAVASGRSSYNGSYNGLYPQVNLSHSYTNSSNLNSSGSHDNWQTSGSA